MKKRQGTVVGVVGAGGISAFHFRAFAETNTKVGIIADLNRAAAEKYITQFGAAYSPSWKDVVENPDVTSVCICAPSPMHYEIAKAALSNGKHVVCEKTLTLCAADSLELGRLAEKKDLILFTAYMKRFFPAVQKARELMSKLGHITSVYCRTYQGVGGVDMHTGEVPSFFAPGKDAVSSVMKMSGGGVLVCGGSHIFDMLLYLVGKPTKVFGRRFIRKGMDVDFMFHALMDLPEGGAIHFEANWHPLKNIGYENRGWDEGFEISGVNGRIVLKTPVWNQPENNAPVLQYYDNRRGTWTEYCTPIVNPFVEAEKHFLAQIAKDRQGEMDRYVGYRVDQIIETLGISATKNVQLEVPWKA